MVEKNDFDFIDEEDIEKAMKNLVGSSGTRKKRKKENIPKKKTTDNPDADETKETNLKNKNKSQESSTSKNIEDKPEQAKKGKNIEKAFEEEAKAIVYDPNLSREEKIEKLNKKLNKRYVRIFDRFKRLSSEEMKIREKVINSFIHSERDVLLLEAGEIVKPDTVYKDVLTYSKEIDTIYNKNTILDDSDIVVLKNFAGEIVKRVSPNQNEALRTLGLTDYIDDDLNYLTIHSVNTAILSIITAIEMTKLMKKKIKEDKEYTINEAQNFSHRIFNEFELVELGLAGLLHDVGLKKQIGGIKRNDEYPEVDIAKYHMHPSNSYYMIDKLIHNISPEAMLAIQNHHENMVKTGFPKQINPRFLDKFSRVLAFVDRYENLAFGSPYVKHYGPSLAMNYLMRKERHKWDGDVIISFVKSTSLYPVGSYVELDNAEIGIVH
ncbi:MAG: HD-GYP domain-containing protein, partial [Spirochaetota bacterium]